MVVDCHNVPYVVCVVTDKKIICFFIFFKTGQKVIYFALEQGLNLGP